MELYLLRHADAGDPGAWNGSDADRPLSGKGHKQAERLGRFLAEIGFRADAVITSPKVRAAQTAELVAEQIGGATTVDPRLGGEVTLSTLRGILSDAHDPGRVVVVGHDPDFSDLLATLCAAERIPMKKGALARIDVDGPLVHGAGTLRWLVPPELLKLDR
jgi:phosphohistidine phosphatase